MIVIRLSELGGWHHLKFPEGNIWFAGYLYDGEQQLSQSEVTARLAALSFDADKLRQELQEFDGLFAGVVTRGNSIIAFTDHIASIRLLICRDGEKTIIADRASEIFPDLYIKTDDVDREAAELFALSGYTVGDATLSKSVKSLPAGFFATVRGDCLRTGRYYTYSSWNNSADLSGDWSERLESVLLATFKRTIRALDGRTVLLPLSAGLDSRLIASAFRMLGYQNVKCFAYGQPGNFEARASQQISARLGYPWTFIPYTHSKQRNAIGRGKHRHYQQFSDSLAATPFEQDYFAIATLLESKWSPPDAVVINGQSGDFITGNHIPPQFGPTSSGCEDWGPIFDALIAKHYSLWAAAKTPESLNIVRNALSRELSAVDAPARPGKTAYGLYEYLEYDSRQSKYVIGGQRVYEFFGLDWRLPLWEKPLVDFCRTLPLEQKFNQRLYCETLHRLNWGNVWRDIDDRRNISPRWLRPIRTTARSLSLPLGQRQWHSIERRLFAYWSDIVCNYSYLNYRHVLTDRRGFRNSVSWLTESYLSRHGIDWRGTPKQP